ncbi:MAG: hypothetical protein Kow0037_16460 [Calditrichia bacterium]
MKRDSLIKYLDYFYVTRPMLFFPGWSTLLIGYWAALGDHDWFTRLLDGRYDVYWLPGDAIWMMVAFAAAMGGSFILNQLQDVETDQKNKKLFLIGGNYLSQQAAAAESALLLAVSVLFAFKFGLVVTALILLFNIITGYMYNYPPFQYKNRAIPGLILNMLMGWIAFALGWGVLKAVNLQFLIVSLPYLLFNTALYFLTTVPDYHGDRESNKITVCVRFGPERTMKYAVYLSALALVAAALNRDQVALFIVLASLPHVIALWRKPHTANAIRLVKMGIFYFAVATCFKFPLFFLLMVSIFFLTRYYYKKRFNYDYPNFKGE